MTDDLLAHFRAVRRPVAKWTHYFAVYQRLLAPYRGRALTLVEVGVAAGGSLEAWRRYLGESARIIGIDVDPEARRFEADGFEIVIGDQSDPRFWTELAVMAPIDVLIDDGGHSSVQQIVTVACGLPLIRDGGVIIVEDTHTSYMAEQYPAPGRYGFMQFAQHVVDVLHRRNPNVTEPAPDSMGLGAAIHRVEFVESMAIFHVDRRLCGRSEEFQHGTIVDGPVIDETSHRTTTAPGRGVLDRAFRAATRFSRGWRAKRYFR